MSSLSFYSPEKLNKMEVRLFCAVPSNREDGSPKKSQSTNGSKWTLFCSLVSLKYIYRLYMYTYTVIPWYFTVYLFTNLSFYNNIICALFFVNRIGDTGFFAFCFDFLLILCPIHAVGRWYLFIVWKIRYFAVSL